MLKSILRILLFSCISIQLSAQDMYTYAHEGEFGVSIGNAYYFGDLHPNNNVLKNGHPQLALGVFYNKQINDYIGIKLNGNYAKLGYADAYNQLPEYQIRNLSFENQVWEMNVMGTFNFFRFVPATEQYRFTPYVGLGIGAFLHNPYTFYKGQKYFLRDIGTEGQGSSQYPNTKKYSKIAMCIPLSLGLKYAFNARTNVFAEACFRFTNTDYLDDVSGNYAPDAFQYNSIGYLLQDRSGEIVPGSFFQKGKQRGNNRQKDAFITLQVGLSFNLQGYRCPNY